MNGDNLSVRDAAAFIAAIDGELEGATREHVDLVRKGRLSQAEADYVVALLRDVRSDLAHAFTVVPCECLERSDPTMKWRDKVRWIDRELDRRNDEFPELVRKGRLTEQDARLGIRVLTTLRRLYWRELFMWEPEPGPAFDWLRAIRRNKLGDVAAIDAAIPDGRRMKMELVRAHMKALELEDQQAQGELVA